MFELTAGTADRPFRDRHLAPTVASMAVHAVLLGAVVGTALFVVTDRLPDVPDIMAFVAEPPAPPPPPPPPPPAPARAEPPRQVEVARPTVESEPLAVSIAVPTGVLPEPIVAGRIAGGVVGGVEGGVSGGVVGGIPGGVPGGVIGGLITEVGPPPSPPREPVRIGGNVEAPRLVRRVEPVYPDIAVAARVTGLVILEATVNERGEVVDVRVLRSRAMLDKAAIDAVKQWRYSPLLLNGEARSFILTVTMNFAIQ
jgi:protein TonB